MKNLAGKKNFLGLYVSSHPLNGFKKLFETKTTAISKIDASFVNKKVILGGLISSCQKNYHKKRQTNAVYEA